MNEINLSDYLISPIYILICYYFINSNMKKNIGKNKMYQYFVKGWWAKIFGGFALAFIYNYYYGGGDTLGFFISAKAMVNLFFKNSSVFFDILINDARTPENHSYFSRATGYPWYYNDDKAFFLVRLITPFVLLSFKSYLAATVLVATFFYNGTWKIFQLFTEYFPKLQKELYYGVLLFPSVVFWGSGILKDTVTFAAAGWFTYAFHRIFVLRKNVIVYSIILFISVKLMIGIKPYVFFALVPGALLWVSGEYISRIKNSIIRYSIAPFIIVVSLVLASTALNFFGDALGEYDPDNILNKAQVTQHDMKQDYYGGQSFDIGSHDGTVLGMIRLAPAAIIATIFRPFIWEARSVVMIISGLENVVLLYFTILILIKVGPFNTFRLITGNPLIQFSFVFAMFFAFSVGVSISNFGSLVRLKIPYIPFYVLVLLYLRNYYLNKNKLFR
jgi:hypothetical protein